MRRITKPIDGSRSPSHALSAAVRELRYREEISQEDLGFRSGLHRNYIGALERGEINPTFRTLLRLAADLGVEFSQLIDRYHRRLTTTDRSTTSRAMSVARLAHGGGARICKGDFCRSARWKEREPPRPHPRSSRRRGRHCGPTGPRGGEMRVARTPDRSAPDGERYVGRHDLARLMGVSVATIDRMVRAGMPSETWGMRARRFRPSEALLWAARRGREAA